MLLLRIALAAALFAQVNARALRNSAEEELAAAPESAATSTAAHGCNEHTVNFILNQGDATHAAIEDDIRTNIEKVGFKTTTTRLSKDDWNAAQVAGNFSISFSETWGAPYDPHSYASAWLTGNEGHKEAFKSLEPPLTRTKLFDRVEKVLKEENYGKASADWKSILSDVHQQAVMLPLYGKRIPTVMNKRLSGYQAGVQQFDYPVHKVKVAMGSKTVTIAPGAQTGRFETVGAAPACKLPRVHPSTRSGASL